MKKFKKFCKIKESDCEYFAPILKSLKQNPTHICKKCKKKSNDKDKLCKPQKIN